MAKYGSSAGWFLVGGYDMVPNKLQGIRCKIESLSEPSHGLGDTWEEQSPIGMCRAELSQDGAFFDTSTSSGFIHTVFSTSIGGQSPSSDPQVVCLGFANDSTGQDFIGIKGEFEQSYEVIAQNGKLTRANVEYVVTGNAEHGKIVFAEASTSGSDNHYLDLSAASTNGGAIYVQVTDLTMTGTTNCRVIIYEAAASSGAYTQIGIVNTTSIGAWRLTTTDDTLERWIAGIINFTTDTTGSASVTCFVGIAKM